MDWSSGQEKPKESKAVPKDVEDQDSSGDGAIKLSLRGNAWNVDDEDDGDDGDEGVDEVEGSGGGSDGGEGSGDIGEL